VLKNKAMALDMEDKKESAATDKDIINLEKKTWQYAKP
jgi:hypothetical protein